MPFIQVLNSDLTLIYDSNIMTMAETNTFSSVDMMSFLLNNKVNIFQTGALLADPCYSYTVLDEPWRAIDQYSQLLCDSNVNWSGWYRLSLHGQSAQMPDTCVSMYSCSTHAPMWLNGQHPRVEDGVVTRHVCGHWNNDCCHFQFYPMKVKACPGNYYVYEFISPTYCYGTYCAGKHSTFAYLDVIDDFILNALIFFKISVLDPRSNNMSYISATPTTPQTGNVRKRYFKQHCTLNN